MKAITMETFAFFIVVSRFLAVNHILACFQELFSGSSGTLSPVKTIQERPDLLSLSKEPDICCAPIFPKIIKKAPILRQMNQRSTGFST